MWYSIIHTECLVMFIFNLKCKCVRNIIHRECLLLNLLNIESCNLSILSSVVACPRLSRGNVVMPPHLGDTILYVGKGYHWFITKCRYAHILGAQLNMYRRIVTISHSLRSHRLLRGDCSILLFFVLCIHQMVPSNPTNATNACNYIRLCM